MADDDYLKPITVGGSVWFYAEKSGLCFVVNAKLHRITWKRLDRLRKQAERANG